MMRGLSAAAAAVPAGDSALLMASNKLPSCSLLWPQSLHVGGWYKRAVQLVQY
jgi:hypothetical protein